MINTIDLNDKTYEERINEAIAQIPVYTDEWTNFNPSEPGITILENLSLFQTLMQENIGVMPIEVRAALLKMAGFSPAKGRSAKVLLQAKGLKQVLELPKGQHFDVYGIGFETKKSQQIGCGMITGIYSKADDEYEAFPALLENSSSIGEKVFGAKPKEGMELYITASGMPKENEELILYVKVKDSESRNPLEAKEKNIFGSLEFEVYTNEGFKHINAKDNTCAFVQDGEIRLRMPEEPLAEFSDKDIKGYCIRARLLNPTYDISPVIVSVSGFLFEVWQQDTKAYCHSSKSSSIVMPKSNYDNYYIMVFAKEDRNSSYRRYIQYTGGDKKDRYFLIEENEKGDIEIAFDKERFGYAPLKQRNGIRVVGYSEEIMKHYRIGQVLGYDDQEFELPLQSVCIEGFCVLCRRTDEKGEYIYDFVRPGFTEEGGLYYLLNERMGTILVKDAGDYIGAELFVGSLAVYQGDIGNIRPGNVFNTEGFSGVTFSNPTKGTLGAYPESLESVRERFVADIETPFTAVTKEDYERLALTTPGLLIKKTRARLEENEARALVTVLPGYGEKLSQPPLLKDYVKRIEKRLEERRLLSTRVKVVQPVYAEVNVRGCVYVKPHFENSQQMIEDAIRSFLDFTASEKGFGDRLRFDEVFNVIENLPCVEYVHSLNLRPKRQTQAINEDMDVQPVWNALVVPGNISIDVVSVKGNEKL